MKSKSWIIFLIVVVGTLVGINIAQYNHPRVVTKTVTTEISAEKKAEIEKAAVEAFKTSEKTRIEAEKKAADEKALAEKTEYEKRIDVTTSILEIEVKPGELVKFFGPQVTVSDNFKVSKLNTNVYLIGGRLGGKFVLKNLIPNQSAYRRFKDRNVFNKDEFITNEEFAKIIAENVKDGEVILILEFDYCKNLQLVKWSFNMPQPPKQTYYAQVDTDTNDYTPPPTPSKKETKKTENKKTETKTEPKKEEEKKPDPEPAVETRPAPFYHETGFNPDGTEREELFKFTVPVGYLCVLGGRVRNGIAGGHLIGLGAGYHEELIKNGFYSYIPAKWAKSEWDFRLGQAIQYNWDRAHIDRGPIPN